MKIISKAPTRISMFGGGTDLNPFNEKFGGRVLNFAINLRHTGELTPRDDKWIWIEAMGESRIWRLNKTIAYGVDPKFDLMRAITNSFRLESGFHYVDTFDGIQGAGLGSSASAAVAFIAALEKWKKYELNEKMIALLAWKTEAYELGWFSGWQDQAASAFGGCHVFEWKFREIEPKEVNREVIESFLPWCVLFFTGKTRKSSEIQQAFYEKMKSKMNQSTKELFRLKELVSEGLEALNCFDYKKVGELLEENWELKKKVSPKASNKRLDRIYKMAKEKGAIGGKILGAGQEGHILFIVPPKFQKGFIKQMEEKGLKQIDFSIDWNGVEVRKI